MPKNKTHCPRPGLEHGPLDPETSTLTMRPLRLPSSDMTTDKINKLQAIQNFAACIVTRSRKFDHITPICKQLCWMPVKDRILFYHDALLTVKSMSGMAPTNLSSRFIKRGTISSRSTCNVNILDIPRYKMAMGQRSVLYCAVTIWNNLPGDIKLSSSINIFKRKLINYLLMSCFQFY